MRSDRAKYQAKTMDKAIRTNKKNSTSFLIPLFVAGFCLILNVLIVTFLKMPLMLSLLLPV
jgi:hypothetical protein